MVRIAVLVILVTAAGALAFALVSAVQFWVVITTRRGGLSDKPSGHVREDLPEALRRFAEAGMCGHTPASRVRFTQTADLIREAGAPWLPFVATQEMATTKAGFLWVARQGRGWVPKVKVLDAYAPDTGGILAVRLFGALPIGTLRGPDVDRAEAMRYLAELPWCPDGILSNTDIRWSEERGRVAAVIDTNGGEARVVFTFDDSGDIVGVDAKDRPAVQPDGSTAYLDWRGSFAGYAKIGPRRVPTEVEVGYDYDTGYGAYFRARITGYEALS